MCTPAYLNCQHHVVGHEPNRIRKVTGLALFPAAGGTTVSLQQRQQRMMYMRKQEADGLLFSMKVSTRQVTIFNASNTFPARMNALFLATEGCSKARPASTHEETHLFVVLNSKTAGESYHTNRPAQKRQEIRFSVRSQGSNGSQCGHRRAQSYSAQNRRLGDYRYLLAHP